MKKVGDERKNRDDDEKERINWKKFFLRFFLSFFIAGALFATTFCIEYFGPLELNWTNNKYRILSDSFFIGGLMPILFWLLVWVSEKGAFDLIVYSVRKVFSFAFRIHPEKSNLPPTYADYVEQKRAKNKPFHYELLEVAGAFLLLGIIFAFVSLSFDTI